jgi:hypothetical protein
MRVTDYSFVFDAWQPDGVTLLGTGYNLATHLGLPYVEFHAWTGDGCVSVRCDPCSLDQDRTAYAAMVRTDLEKAICRGRQGAQESRDMEAQRI